MWRAVLAGVAGYLGWWIIGTIGFLALRHLWPEYASVEAAMSFTLGMQLARLAVGALCSLGAGALVSLICRRRSWVPWVPWVLGVVLTLQFIPVHYSLWTKYPLWYHAIFLLTLMPLVVLGSRLPSTRSPSPGAGAAMSAG